MKGILQLLLFAAGIVVIAVGLGAIQLIPTNELTKYSVREEFSFARSSEGELWWQQLITILIPKFFGSSNSLGARNPTPYWGPESNWNYWETCVYTGIAALALAFFSLKYFKRNKYIALTAGFALFGLLYALGDNFILHGFFYHYIPGFDKFRSLGRWGFFFVFAVAFLSGFGLQELITSKNSNKFFKRVIIALGGLTVLVVLAVQFNFIDAMIIGLLRTGAFRFESQQTAFAVAYEIAKNQTLISAVIIFCTLGLLFLFWKGKLSKTTTVVALFAVQFIDMYIFGFNQNNGAVNPDDHFNQRAELIQHWKEEGKSEYFRINMRNSYGMLLDRNQGMIDRIFLIEGYSQLGLQWRFPPPGKHMLDLLNSKYRLLTDTILYQGQPRLQTQLSVDTAYLPRAFFVYDYKTFPTAQQESLFIVDEQFNPWKVVTLRDFPDTEFQNFDTSNWTATIQSYTNNTIGLKVYTSKKGILVLSEIFCPGWNAYVDGVPTPVYRANWSLRALVVDKGEHSVFLRYEPNSFYLGATISFSMLGLCMLSLAILYLQK